MTRLERGIQLNMVIKYLKYLTPQTVTLHQNRASALKIHQLVLTLAVGRVDSEVEI